MSTTRVVWARPMVSTVLYLLDKFTNMYLYTHAEKTYADNILLQLNIDEYFIDCRYREDNIEKIRKSKKQYREDNIQKIRKSDKEYRIKKTS